MRPDERPSEPPQPATRQDLAAWIRDNLNLPAAIERDLIRAIDGVLTRHEHLWQESKQEAIQALLAGFADKMARLTLELRAKDVTVSSISAYFEQLVAELTDRAHRDPKTKLMNFGRFTEQLEAFLALEQRGRWCAVGLVDIAGFKRYNDTLGHPAGDRIIARVARLLREQVRSKDVIAPGGVGELHARLGGDEFCFLIPDLKECRLAHAIAERFRSAVERFDWSTEESRLGDRPVRVDVGVVCLTLGRVSGRRFVARRLAAGLIQRADELMYAAKGQRVNRVHIAALKVEEGELAAMPDEDVGDMGWATGIEPATS